MISVATDPSRKVVAAAVDEEIVIPGVGDMGLAFTAADFAARASNRRVRLAAGIHTMQSNATFDAPVVFSPGAVINRPAGVAVTFNGSVTADPTSQIFSGSGTVVWGNGQTIFRPEWWGVVANDGTRTIDATTAPALQTEGIANSLALQQLLDSLPGQGSTSAAQMNRQKQVLWRPGYYLFNPRDAGTCSINNRRITFAAPHPGKQFTTVIQIYSRAADGAGSNARPLLHILGRPGTAPNFDNVSGEIVFRGIRFEGTEFSLTHPTLQVGGVVSGSNFTAQDASPVTGVYIDDCGFAQVYAPVRFTFAGACKFTNNLVDGGNYGGLSGHGVQELEVTGNRFNALAFFPWQFNATGALTWNGGQPMNKPCYFNMHDNEIAGGLDYGGQGQGGWDGVLQVINDADNALSVCRVQDNRIIGVGNKQEAVFAEAKSALIYADVVTDLHIDGNYVEEWPGMATHWAYLVKIGTSVDRLFIGDKNVWNIAYGTALFSIPAGATVVDIREELTRSVANAGTFAFPKSPYGMELRLTEITLGGVTGKFITAHQSGTSAKVAETVATAFSNTKDVANTANVYVAAGSAVTTLQNNLGSTRSFRISARYF